MRILWRKECRRATYELSHPTVCIDVITSIIDIGRFDISINSLIPPPRWGIISQS